RVIDFGTVGVHVVVTRHLACIDQRLGGLDCRLLVRRIDSHIASHAHSLRHAHPPWERVAGRPAPERIVLTQLLGRLPVREVSDPPHFLGANGPCRLFVAGGHGASPPLIRTNMSSLAWSCSAQTPSASPWTIMSSSSSSSVSTD